MLLEEIRSKKTTPTRNFVAKHSRNKAGAGAHRDKKKDYKRKPKHKKELFND